MDLFTNLLGGFLQSILDVLPTSPFAGFISSLEGLPFLTWLNWFLPVGDILTVMVAWLGAIALFYIYSIILRWARAIS